MADFGIARLADSQTKLTATGVLLGTPAYMTPEHLSSDPVGPAADRYALAVVAYELLTGQVPYEADTALKVLLAHLQAPLPDPRTVNPALREALVDVLQRGLAKRPDDRYPSAAAFVQALAGAAGPARARSAATSCGACGAGVQAGDRFCRSCGSLVGSATVPTPAPIAATVVAPRSTTPLALQAQG